VLHTAGDDGTDITRDYEDDPEAELIAATLTTWVRSTRESAHAVHDVPRGEPGGVTICLPRASFHFIQNHDQVGNRAFGERLTELVPEEALRAAAAVQLLAPQIPLLFMGEQWGCRSPFQFFCDFGGELAAAVVEGRRREFGLRDLPDPGATATMERSRPGNTSPEHEDRRNWYRRLLAVRRESLVPLLSGMGGGVSCGGGDFASVVRWEPGWTMVLNLAPRARAIPEEGFRGAVVFATHPAHTIAPPWSVTVRCEAAREYSGQEHR
jgi:1,4-alpha-glucan branching enzyme